MKNFSSVIRTVVCVGLAIPTILFAQEPLLLAAAPADATATTASPMVSTVATAPVANSPNPLTGRWLDLKTLSHAERYRNTFDNGGDHVFEDGQQRSLIEGKLKLDVDGRYAIGFRASSGRYFNWAYADYAGHGFQYNLIKSGHFAKIYTPAEAAFRVAAIAADTAGHDELNLGQSAGWEFYLRELYFSATPVKAVTVEVGSFGIERGVSSEITTFDEDGYITGERVRIHDAKHLIFDEVGYTNAFFGHATDVNVFDRGSDYKHANYHQFFVKKVLNSHVAVSGEYTLQVGTNTIREAVAIKTPEVKVVDQIRFEAYERPNTVYLQGLAVASGSGFAVTFDKKLTSRLSGDFGFDSIDQRYGVYYGHISWEAVGWTLNGDSYGLGTRPFVHASYEVNPVISAFGFYTHAVGARDITFSQQGLNVGLSFNLKALVNSEKKVF